MDLMLAAEVLARRRGARIGGFGGLLLAPDARERERLAFFA